MQSMRKRIINERRDELKELPREDFVSYVRNFPNQESLDFDDEGNKRDHQVGLMAKVIEENDFNMTDKQYFTMIDNFTKVTVPDMKIVGVSFKDPDVENFKKDLVSEKMGGRVKYYDIDYHLENEQDNPYDENAVKVSVENVNGELEQIGYLQRDFVEKYEVEDGVIQGLMADHSNGKFKNVSYNIALDTEKLALKTGERETVKEIESEPVPPINKGDGNNRMRVRTSGSVLSEMSEMSNVNTSPKYRTITNADLEAVRVEMTEEGNRISKDITLTNDDLSDLNEPEKPLEI